MALIEEENVSLIRGVQGVDPSSGYKLTTYVAWWIKQAIRRALTDKAKTIHMPFHMIGKLSKLKTTATNLLDKLERPPSCDELAGAMDSPLKKVESLDHAIRSAGPLKNVAILKNGQWKAFYVTKDI